MRRCSLVELDDGQCRWPLGDAHQVATQFCGGDAVPGRCYCAHHLQRAPAGMLDLHQVHRLLAAERSRDIGVITAAVNDVLAMSPEVSPLDIEMVFRDAGSPVYLISKPELTIVISMPAWRSALDRLGMSPQENRYALAGTTGHS